MECLWTARIPRTYGTARERDGPPTKRATFNTILTSDPEIGDVSLPPYPGLPGQHKYIYIYPHLFVRACVSTVSLYVTSRHPAPPRVYTYSSACTGGFRRQQIFTVVANTYISFYASHTSSVSFVRKQYVCMCVIKHLFLGRKIMAIFFFAMANICTRTFGLFRSVVGKLF